MLFFMIEAMIYFSLTQIYYAHQIEILLKSTKINSLEPINPKTAPTEPSKLTVDPTKLTNQANGLSNTSPKSDPRTLTNPTSH